MLRTLLYDTYFCPVNPNDTLYSNEVSELFLIHLMNTKSHLLLKTVPFFQSFY